MHVHSHDHTHAHAPAGTSGRRLLWTMVFNLVITAAEFVGGLMSGYLALLADAVHNLSDVASLGLAWLGARGSEMPPTKRSTYGHGRIEVMTAFVSAVSLVVIAVFILSEAYDRLINPQPIHSPGLFITVAVIGLLGNVVSIWLLNSEKGKSLNMKTAFLHMFYDALSSIAVIVGGIVMLLTGWYLLDVILSTLIALMIVWSSWLVIKEAVLILLEAVPPGIDFDAVHKALLTVPDVCDVHDLHIWSLSSKAIALSCHVLVDESDLAGGQVVIDKINALLRERFGIGHGTIQLETGSCVRADDILCRPNDNS